LRVASAPVPVFFLDEVGVVVAGRNRLEAGHADGVMHAVPVNAVEKSRARGGIHSDVPFPWAANKMTIGSFNWRVCVESDRSGG
jgi:hypothetical protein